ncbi:MAG: IS3 family transposase, partial [Oceanospirillaceae bacterium]|nr:IS3 family transposase [Oceanospirillaceae bacterium]
MTRLTRPTFSPEFRLESVQLVVDQGYTIREAAEAMNVGKSTMDKWVRQLKQERSGSTPSASPMTAEQRRLRELERQVKRLETEKDILKKGMVSSTGQRKYALQLLQRCQVVECFPRSFIQLP